jgi:hypothetical protein
MAVRIITPNPENVNANLAFANLPPTSLIQLGIHPPCEVPGAESGENRAHCTCGVLSCGDWKNGFSKEARELRLGSPVRGRAFQSKRKGGSTNDQSASCTAVGRQNHAGSGAVPPLLLLAYSKWPSDQNTCVLFLVLRLEAAAGYWRFQRRLAHCTCGVLSYGDWKNGFSKEAPEPRLGKPGSWPDLPVKTETVNK